MASPTSLRQIAREALGEVPAWVDRILTPLNLVLGQLQDALSGNLTISENLAMAWVELTVTEGQAVAPQAIPGLRGRTARGLSVERVQVQGGGAAPTGPVWVEWAPTSVRKGETFVPGVQLSAVYGLATGTRATLTLLVKAS